MKKKIISLLLAVVMIVGMLPLGAITAFAAESDIRNKWNDTLVSGTYGYVRSSDLHGAPDHPDELADGEINFQYYPLDDADDFEYCFRENCSKSGRKLKKVYEIHLFADFEPTSFIADAMVMRIYLNGHTLNIKGDAEVSVNPAIKPPKDFQILGDGGMISFPNNTKASAFTLEANTGLSGNAHSYEVENVTFSGCKGRVFNFYTTDVVLATLNNITFKNCSADYGSCIYINSNEVRLQANSCSFINCTAYQSGGAVYIKNVKAAMDRFQSFNNCTVKNCKANGTSSTGKGDGGGFIYVADSEAYAGIYHTDISDCSGKYGGAIYNYGDNVFFENSTAHGCEASNDGGFLYNYNDGAYVHITDSAISDCEAKNGNGGGIYTNGKLADLENSVIRSCKATGYGGGLYVANTSALVNNFEKDTKAAAQEDASNHGYTVISGCSAKYGGGVYAADVDLLQNIIFADNQSTYHGGGLYNYTGAGAASTVNNCRFYRNTALNNYYGGGIYINDSDGTVENCQFFENIVQE